MQRADSGNVALDGRRDRDGRLRQHAAHAEGHDVFRDEHGTGKGASLGGLDGAGACRSLAKAAGAGDRTWRAYLSTQAPALNDPKFVNARDRIGTGPWQNAKGVVVARSVDDLHSASANITKETALDEKSQAR